MNYIVAGGPVRNRSWAIPRHVEAVRRNFPQALFYLTSRGNDDDTIEALWDAEVDVEAEDEAVKFAERPHYSTSHLAERRNRWLELALYRWPYLTGIWVVDSDVVPERGCLDALLDVSADVVGANVWIPSGRCPEPMEGETWDCGRGMWLSSRTGEEKTRTIPVHATLVGSCFLVRRSAIDAGLRWEDHPQGENGGMSRMAKDLGLTMMWCPKARCQHLTKESK